MNLALLGGTPDILPLVREITGSSDFALTRAALVGDSPTLHELLRLVPGLRVGESWDQLLVAADVDAVLVSGADEAVLDAAKQVAASGKPLVVLPDVRQGSQWIYELSLIRDDTRIPLVPLFMARLRPAVQELARRLHASQLGRLLRFQLERDVPGTGMPPLLTPAQIEHSLLDDADVLRSLGGDYNQVTALYTGVLERGVSLATVTLAGAQGPEAIWSLHPTTGVPTARLQVIGEEGSAELSLADTDAPLVLTRGEHVERISTDTISASEHALEHIERALRGESTSPDWTDLVRAFETVEATRRSVRRRRTIDLHFETTSERSQFKTQMVAAGCGLLVLTFFAVLAVLMAGAILDINPQVLRIARVAVFAPLFLFLALQFLLFLARPTLSAREERESKSPRTVPDRERD